MDGLKKEEKEALLEKNLDVQNLSRKKLHWLRSLGPGLITGASDDDPSGIATYSQAGAQFGFGMLWLALFQYPMMTVIQEMSGRQLAIDYLVSQTKHGWNNIEKATYAQELCIGII